ncbi:MAG: isoprenylcysteine carboxylmethyltransferase family protein [Anaerolineales bacterium]
MAQEISPEDRKTILKWCIQSAGGLVGYAAIIFLAAGRLDWLWGWVFIGLTAIFLASHVVLLVPINPDLLVERAGGLRQEGGKRWDRWVAMLSGGVFPIASWYVAGLDLRFAWSSPKPLAVHLLGTGMLVLGWTLFMWAMVSNAYFSEVVRIQEDRGHQVATDGPYRFVRHPGYIGAILSFLGSPLLLGSYWAFIPTVIGVGGYVLRTALEDRTLQRELEGYRAYTEQVRYRLVPGVW